MAGCGGRTVLVIVGVLLGLGVYAFLFADLAVITAALTQEENYNSTGKHTRYINSSRINILQKLYLYSKKL